MFSYENSASYQRDRRLRLTNRDGEEIGAGDRKSSGTACGYGVALLRHEARVL
jgi:hypothetical protein